MNLKWGPIVYAITFTIVSVIVSIAIYQEVTKTAWQLILTTNIGGALIYMLIYRLNKREFKKQSKDQLFSRNINKDDIT